MKRKTTWDRGQAGLLVAALATGVLLSLQVVAADFPARGDPARGARAWASNCVRCHNIREPRELRDDQWITTMHHMRVRAGLTGQQMRDILTFLQESN